MERRVTLHVHQIRGNAGDRFRWVLRQVKKSASMIMTVAHEDTYARRYNCIKAAKAAAKNLNLRIANEENYS